MLGITKLLSNRVNFVWWLPVTMCMAQTTLTKTGSDLTLKLLYTYRGQRCTHIDTPSPLHAMISKPMRKAQEKQGSTSFFTIEMHRVLQPIKTALRVVNIVLTSSSSPTKHLGCRDAQIPEALVCASSYQAMIRQKHTIGNSQPFDNWHPRSKYSRHKNSVDMGTRLSTALLRQI